MSTVPKRYRSELNNNKPKEFERKQRQQIGQQQQGRRKAKSGRQENDLSMPLERSGFDMSVPLGPSARMMSIPLQERGVEMSMALRGFDLSMPMDESEVVTLDNGSGSDGNAPLLASFLAGTSAAVVGSLALFAKMRQKKHVLQAEESQQERENMEVQEGSLSAQNDLIADGEMRYINIT